MTTHEATVAATPPGRDLPFDPVAEGWRDGRPFREYRPELARYKWYAWPAPCRCSRCRYEHDEGLKAECLVILIDHDKFPLGDLWTLCPTHLERSKYYRPEYFD